MVSIPSVLNAGQGGQRTPWSLQEHEPREEARRARSVHWLDGRPGWRPPPGAASLPRTQAAPQAESTASVYYSGINGLSQLFNGTMF